MKAGIKMKRTHLLVGLLFALTLTACEKYFGDKTDLSFIEVPDYSATREIAYVPISPAISGFERPVDICVGFDELFYVVDEAAQRVYCMDETGNILGSILVPGARAVVQDRKFDLLVIGTTDSTFVQGTTQVERTLTTIYRIRMIGGNGYNISNAQIINKVIHPFYVRSTVNSNDEASNARFNRIGIIGHNSAPDLNNNYYVTRTGIGSMGVLGPYDAILYFNNQDEFISTVSVNTPTEGVRNDFFQNPFGITTMAQPPQLNATQGRQFYYTSVDQNVIVKIGQIEYFESETDSYFQAVQFDNQDTSKADGFINETNKFKAPTGITIAGDASQYLFVTDTLTDSLYQFTLNGLEGILPPAATGITKYQSASFGGLGDGLTQFNDPLAVAYFNEIVYVADAGNGRILRFKLTTDFD